MKRILSFILLFTALLIPSSVVHAATRQTVTIPHPMTLASIKLVSGDYDVMWTGDAGNLQVTFMQGKKTFVTAPARLVEGTNRFIGVESGTRDGVEVVQVVRMKNATLYFDAAPATK